MYSGTNFPWSSLAVISNAKQIVIYEEISREFVYIPTWVDFPRVYYFGILLWSTKLINIPE